MSNRLKMAIVHSIHQLHSLHWSHRRIARELGIDRGTAGWPGRCGFAEARNADPRATVSPTRRDCFGRKHN
jgi:hypothetical protein